MIFSVYSVKMLFLFPTKMHYVKIRSTFPCSVRMRENTDQKKLRFGHFSCKHYITLLSKIKDDLLPKNTLKNDNSSTTGKDVTHPRKYGISLIEQLEIMKKFTQSLLTHREN